jgi:hypothetical protein
MKSICFFPFTHITEVQIQAVTSFFPKVGFLSLNPEIPAGSTVAESVENGRLLPLSLPVARFADIDARVQSYLDWAGLHKGNEKNLKSLIKETAYFREDTGLTAIQSQIRLGSEVPDPEGESRQHRDPLLFMKFAEIWDMENDSIQNELEALDAGNLALFAELKGETDTIVPTAGPSQGPASGFDPGETMTEERVRAWGDLAGEAGLYSEGDGPLVLVTTSPAVMDYLISSADQVKNVLDIESIKVHENGCARKERWQQDIINILDETLSSNAPSGKELTENAECCALAGLIRYCLLSGKELNKMFKMPGEQIGKQIAVCLVKLNS